VENGANASEEINFQNKAIHYRMLNLRLFSDIQKITFVLPGYIMKNVYLLIPFSVEMMNYRIFHY